MLDQLVIPGFEDHLLFGEDEPEPRPVPAVADIKREVALFFRIPVAEMVSQRRSRDVARPRQVAMYLAKQLTPRSLPNIGRLFGNRDHTTVIHAIRQIERLILADSSMADAVRELDARL